MKQIIIHCCDNNVIMMMALSDANDYGCYLSAKTK